jgi:hypothetical protein
MEIAIDLATAPAGVELHEPSVFVRFAVVVAGEDPQRLAEAVARIGRVADEDHVLVDPIALTALAGDAARDPEWTSGLRGMIDYARSKGWVDDAGRVRAHIERRSHGATRAGQSTR